MPGTKDISVHQSNEGFSTPAQSNGGSPTPPQADGRIPVVPALILAANLLKAPEPSAAPIINLALHSRRAAIRPKIVAAPVKIDALQKLNLAMEFTQHSWAAATDKDRYFPLSFSEETCYLGQQSDNDYTAYFLRGLFAEQQKSASDKPGNHFSCEKSITIENSKVDISDDINPVWTGHTAEIGYQLTVNHEDNGSFGAGEVLLTEIFFKSNHAPEIRIKVEPAVKVVDFVSQRTGAYVSANGAIISYYNYTGTPTNMRVANGVALPNLLQMANDPKITFTVDDKPKTSDAARIFVKEIAEHMTNGLSRYLYEEPKQGAHLANMRAGGFNW